jgi:hypothetical protein
MERWLFAALLCVACLWGHTHATTADPTPPAVTLIEQQLNGSLADASRDSVSRTVQLLVKDRPQAAPEVIAAIARARHKSHDCEMGAFVGAAIAALNALDAKAARPVILAIIERAIAAEPRCAPTIVAAAVKVAPALATAVVETAVASLPDPTLLIGGVTLTEAVANAAIAALQNGLPPVAAGPNSATADPAQIFDAANRGLRLTDSGAWSEAWTAPSELSR